MSALIYIHGFLSSPLSHKAQQVKAWLGENRADIDYHCPFIPPYPGQARDLLENLVESLVESQAEAQPRPVYLMGSSLGGFWATYLAEKYDLRAVLINPAVKPSMLMPEYVGVELQNYHTDDTHVLSERHIDELRAVDTPQIHRLANYWLMAQTGDETLDYRLAVEKYQGCKQLVEEGGDHAFQGFEHWISDAIDFLAARETRVC